MRQYLGILREKGQKKFLEGFAREKYKYFKPQPEMQQQKRFLLHFYVTIFGHFKGKSPKNFFTRLWKGKTRVFEAPTGYRTAEEGFIAFLCDNIWAF